MTELDERLASFLPVEGGQQDIVIRAMRDAFLAGGKRVRPRLCWETYRLFGGTGEEIWPMMAALEMIHTSSLIHDDLPAMDNDRLRRGRPTTWVSFGEDMAILAGDGLMIYAFETAARALSMGAPADRVSAAMAELARRTGIFGMIGGQTADVAWTGKPVPRETLEFIYREKTGALLEASMVTGAILAGADEAQQEAVRRIASCVGMAFQIRDDLLDIESTEEELGKPIGSDERNQKTTFVTVYGEEKARELVRSYSEEAVALLGTLPGDTEPLARLIRSLMDRKN